LLGQLALFARNEMWRAWEEIAADLEARGADGE
jgi:hypothetical protein